MRRGPIFRGPNHSFIRRSVYGHGQRWVTAPPPYQSRYNLPAQLRRTPWDLMRSHSHPKDPRTVSAAIQQAFDEGRDPRTAVFPRNSQRHPYSSPIPPAQVLGMPQQIADLQRQALQKMGLKQPLSREEAQALFSVQLPQPYARMRAEPPGLQVRQLPRLPRSGPPPEAVRLQAALQNPATRSRAPAHVAADPDAAAERVHQAAYVNAAPNDAVNVVLQRRRGRR